VYGSPRHRIANVASRLIGHGSFHAMPAVIATPRQLLGLKVGAKYSQGSTSGLGAATISYVTSAEDTSATSFSQSMSWGTANVNRKIIVSVSMLDHEFESTPTVSGVTVGGDAATLVTSDGNAGGRLYIFAIDKASGASGTVAVSFSGTVRHISVYIHRLISTNVTAWDTDTQVGNPGTGTNPTTTPQLDMPANSCLLILAGAASNDSDSAAPFTWSSLGAVDAAQSDSSGNDAEIQSLDVVGATTHNETITYNLTSAIDSQMVGFVAASWTA